MHVLNINQDRVNKGRNKYLHLIDEIDLDDNVEDTCHEQTGNSENCAHTIRLKSPALEHDIGLVIEMRVIGSLMIGKM